MSFQWSDMDSKYTMFEKNVDVFNKDGCFKIIELPEKNVINDLKNGADTVDENEQEEGSLKLNIKLANEDASNNVKEKDEDAENEEKMKQLKMAEQYQMMQQFEMMHKMRMVARMFQGNLTINNNQEQNFVADV